MSNINLNLMRESIKRAGNKTLTEEELKVFILETIQHESKNLRERIKKAEEGEIKEGEINDFPFYTDGVRVGVLIEMSDENVLPATSKLDEDGEPTLFMPLYKKNKDGEYIYDDNGNAISTGRILMRIKTRNGNMGLFVGETKFEEFVEDKFFVLIGTLKTQYKNLNTNKYVSESQMLKQIDYAKENGLLPDEYSAFKTYSLNVFQIGEVIQSGKNIKVKMPKCNWKNGDD